MKRFSGSSAIARHQVFITNSGVYVVQWDDDLVQDILSGEYLEFNERKDYGRVLNDHDLQQLINAGRVERYNRQYVWLMPLPESLRNKRRRVLGNEHRIRAFYLITQHQRAEVEKIRALLKEHTLTEICSARIRDERVVILGPSGVPFRDAEVAEQTQQFLENKLPRFFSGLFLAFIELNGNTSLNRSVMENESTSVNLNDIIASQSENTSLEGKTVVLAIPQDDERAAFTELLKSMKITIRHANSGAEAMHLLEDYPSQLLIMDIVQPDMHGWPLITKIREISTLRDLPITIIAEKAEMGMTVAKVDYLARPVSIARLRHSVWMALKNDPTESS